MLTVTTIFLMLVSSSLAGSPSYSPKRSLSRCPKCQDVYDEKEEFASCLSGDHRRDPDEPNPCDGAGDSVRYAYLVRRSGDQEVWGCCAGSVALRDEGPPATWGDARYKLL